MEAEILTHSAYTQALSRMWYLMNHPNSDEAIDELDSLVPEIEEYEAASEIMDYDDV